MVFALQEFEEGLRVKSQYLDDDLAKLEPQILDIQQRLEEYSAVKSGLRIDLDLAEETYKTMARKVDETTIRSEAANGELKVVSEAQMPGGPVSPRRLFNTVLAGVAGAIVAVLAVLLFAYWRQEPE